MLTLRQAEQQRILDALNQNGGEEPAGPEEDVEGLDPNDDDTCKICMEEYVDVSSAIICVVPTCNLTCRFRCDRSVWRF